jgi:hypothetical protein
MLFRANIAERLIQKSCQLFFRVVGFLERSNEAFCILEHAAHKTVFNVFKELARPRDSLLFIITFVQRTKRNKAASAYLHQLGLPGGTRMGIKWLCLGDYVC